MITTTTITNGKTKIGLNPELMDKKAESMTPRNTIKLTPKIPMEIL